MLPMELIATNLTLETQVIRFKIYSTAMTVPRHPLTTSRGRGGVHGGRQEEGARDFSFFALNGIMAFQGGIIS